MKNKVVINFGQKEPVIVQVLRMSGCLSLKDLMAMVKEMGFVFGQAELLHLEMLVSVGTVHKTNSKGGQVLYRWPEQVQEMPEDDDLHERLYVRYGVRSFTTSKAAKELSLDRSDLQAAVDRLVKSGRLKEQGMRKFMGHPFQTYKVV